MHGAKHLDRLILDLLEYSRVGRGTPEPSLVDMADCVATALANLEVLIAETGATVTVTETLPRVVGQETELVRLFQNLIGNGIKYHAPNRAPVLEIGCQQQGPKSVFWVRDNGIGIPHDQQDRVFLIFQRLHTSQEYEGTGIGLSVCKKIVEHHGGRIWIDSTEGEGSTFYFSLPKSDLPS